MKRFSHTKEKFLSILFLFITVLVNAAEPTTSASNVQFAANLIDGGQFTVSFTAGNGTGGRIVVVKEGSEITGIPVDGTKYDFNPAFGTQGTSFSAPGEFVVAHTTLASTNVTVTKLKPGTTYYIAIFELNGNYNTPSTIDYSIVTPTDKKVITLSTPTTAATITGFTQVTGNSVKINWTSGNGQGRIIVAKKGSSLTAIPEDLKSYNYLQDFGAGSGKLDAETFVVYKTTGNSLASIDINGLEPNATYTFAVFEFNGNNSPVYHKVVNTSSVTTNAGPTIGTNTIIPGSIQGNSISLTIGKGNGSKRIVIAKKNSAVTSIPVNGTRYIANAAFNTPAAEFGSGSDEYVVYAGTGVSVTITNLELFTNYHFAVYEFDEDLNGKTYYLTGPQSSTLPARKSQGTLLPPTANTTLTITKVTGNSAQLNYVYPPSGFGTYRLLAIRKGAPVEFLPTDLQTYSGSANYNYGTGQLVGPDTYVLISGSNGGAPNVGGLTPGEVYHVTVFDLHGTSGPVYLRPGSSAVITVPNEPSAGSTTPRFTTIDGNYLRFDWSSGTGSKRVVVVRKGAPVSNFPQDGISYNTAAKFGDGAELSPGSGEFVVYNGSGNSVTVTGLDKATTYHFAVFEYNDAASGPDYLITSGKYLTASQATVSAPTTQTSNLNAINILSDRATVNFGVGNGNSRIFVMKENTPVDAAPVDLSTYSYINNMFGMASTQISPGNYVVSVGSLSNFTVTGLKPGTSYYITAFEFNGNAGPVYLTPGATMYHFTTSGSAPVSAPTQVATAPNFINIDGNKFEFKWTNGNGAKRIVVARKNAAVDFVPADGNDYAANASFGSNTDLGGGQYVVFNNSASSVQLTGLAPNTTYHFAVYEYNGTAGTAKYMTTSLSGSSSTAKPPAVKSSGAVVTTASNSATLSWVNGSGAGRVVVAKEGSEVTAIPVTLNKYIGNSQFKNGPQLASGEYIVYDGTGNAVTVSGLEANKTYHFSVFEYSGSDAPVYNTVDVLKIAATINSTLPLNWVFVNARENNGSVSIAWATEQESNTAYYAVEKSSDGFHFNPVATVKASGDARQTSYYSADDRVDGQLNIYYRVKQVDKDGKYTYSKTIHLSGKKSGSIRLLQNPVRDELKFLSDEEMIGSSYLITTATGSVINIGRISATMTTVPLHNASSGVYYLTARHKASGRKIVTAFIRE